MGRFHSDELDSHFHVALLCRSGWANYDCDGHGLGGFLFMVIGIPLIGLLLAYFWRTCRRPVVVVTKGDRVAVFWRSENEWFPGTLVAIDMKHNTASVRYDDGDFDGNVAVDVETFCKLNELAADAPRGGNAAAAASTSFQYQELTNAASLD